MKEKLNGKDLINIGQELSAAVLTRGLCAEKKRTNICRIGFHLQDIAKPCEV